MVKNPARIEQYAKAGVVELEALYRRPHPSWLKQKKLRDNIWVIQTGDPQIRRNASEVISFEIPIAPGRLLTDPREWKDLLTAKTYVYEALSGRDAWIHLPGPMKTELAGLITFIRWRTERGLPTMSALREVWFREFCDSLTENGVEGLVRSEEAVAGVMEAIAQGKAPLPRNLANPEYFSPIVAAHMAGFSSAHQLSHEAVRRIAQFARERGLLLPRAFKRLDHTPPKRTYKGASFDRYIRPWMRLGRLRERMPHDPIGYVPFTDRSELTRLTRVMGGPLARTKTAPATQVCFLVDRAIRWVLLYADDLHIIVDRAREGQAAEQSPRTIKRRARVIRDAWLGADLQHILNEESLGAPKLTRVVQRGSASEITDLQTAHSRLLPAACAIVIAAFSARRLEEIVSLRYDCVEIVDEEPWLRTFIAKGSGGQERIPAPTIVLKAVEVLDWISRPARQRTGKPWLFQAADPLSDTARTFEPDLRTAIIAFADAMEVPKLADGSTWAFAPHQFRRFFAVIYYYRYRDRSLTALTQYLQHHDPDSTRTYITEARTGGFLKMIDEARAVEIDEARKAHSQERSRSKVIDDVALEFRAEIFRGALDGTEHVSGFGGVRLVGDLKRLVAKWSAEIEIGNFETTTPTLDELIVQFAYSRRLEPNGLGHSYCSCESTEADVSAARCVLEAEIRGTGGPRRLGPDLRYAEDMTCSACPHNVQLAENERYWRELVTSCCEVSANCPGTILAEKMTLRARSAQDHLARCFGSRDDKA